MATASCDRWAGPGTAAIAAASESVRVRLRLVGAAMAPRYVGTIVSDLSLTPTDANWLGDAAIIVIYSAELTRSVCAVDSDWPRIVLRHAAAQAIAKLTCQRRSG